MNKGLILFGLGVLFSCGEQSEKENSSVPVENNSTFEMRLDLNQAERIVQLPLHCIDVEFPNKLNQTIDGPIDLQTPSALHPAFYGCFDWHSAVHGHWSLVRLAKTYPKLSDRSKIISALSRHLTKENIVKEINYFEHKYAGSFERMYGWAWLLKLAEELHHWSQPEARILEQNLQPLTDLIAQKAIEFLPKLQYPIRVGTHTNTAFAMTLAFDYAVSLGNDNLKKAIVQRAKDFFLEDKNGPLSWEPSGYDFLSPCLEEADIMRRVLSKEEFKKWLVDFLPQLVREEFVMEPGIVSDRTDGHLVHLDGLNYSRAWCLFGIVETLPDYTHLIKIANAHIKSALPNLTDGNYEGGHWLASFALLALSE